MISTPPFIIGIGIGIGIGAVVISVLAFKFGLVPNVKSYTSTRIELWLSASIAVIIGFLVFLSKKIF